MGHFKTSTFSNSQNKFINKANAKRKVVKFGRNLKSMQQRARTLLALMLIVNNALTSLYVRGVLGKRESSDSLFTILGHFMHDNNVNIVINRNYTSAHGILGDPKMEYRHFNFFSVIVVDTFLADNWVVTTDIL